MLVKLSQFLNVESPTPITPVGMVTLVKFVQPSNAEFPMLVTVFGIEHLLNFRSY